MKFLVDLANRIDGTPFGNFIDGIFNYFDLTHDSQGYNVEVPKTNEATTYTFTISPKVKMDVMYLTREGKTGADVLETALKFGLGTMIEMKDGDKKFYREWIDGNTLHRQELVLYPEDDSTPLL